MRWISVCLAAMVVGLTPFANPHADGQDVKLAIKPVDPANDLDQSSREQRLAKYLTGAKFVGSFSVDGTGSDKLKEETYIISKCEKLPAADMYRLTARIKYGDTDGEFPMELKILWAGDTPVITLDQLWIPGLGTFSSRVLILNGRYAGTWDHGSVGGHLFGRIEREVPEPAATGEPAETGAADDAADQ